MPSYKTTMNHMKRNRSEVVATIREVLIEIIKERTSLVPEITEDTEFLGTELPIDSLDLATLVVELEQRLQQDPFKSGFKAFRTVGELSTLYADA